MWAESWHHGAKPRRRRDFQRQTDRPRRQSVRNGPSVRLRPAVHSSRARRTIAVVATVVVAALAVLGLLLAVPSGPGTILVTAQHAPLETPSPGGFFSCGPAQGQEDVALTGFENATAVPIRIIHAQAHTLGGVIVDKILLQRPGTVNQAQPGITTSPIYFVRTGRPVVTIPVTSAIPPHKWAQFVVRIHLGSGQQSGELRSVTLTYISGGQRYKTDYVMPSGLCRTMPGFIAPGPLSRSCC